MAKFEVTFYRDHKGMGHVEKKVEIIEAEDSGEAMEVTLQRTGGTSWRINRIEEIR